MFKLEEARELSNKIASRMLTKDYFLYGPDLNKYLKIAMMDYDDNFNKNFKHKTNY